jgi:hypothetical protein
MHALENQVHELTEERTQLNERLASLEKQLKDVTGTIQKQVGRMGEMPATAEIKTPNVNKTDIQVTNEKDPEHASGPLSAASVIDPIAMGVTISPAKQWSDEQPQHAPPAPKQQLASLAAGEAPPLPNARFIASPPKPPKPAVDELPIQNQQYGIELATGTDLNGLRNKWSAIKANIGPLLTGLQPVAVYDHQKKGDVYHLILGPLPSLVSAHQVCARFSAARVSCRPAHFDGQTIVQR